MFISVLDQEQKWTFILGRMATFLFTLKIYSLVEQFTHFVFADLFSYCVKIIVIDQVK